MSVVRKCDSCGHDCGELFESSDHRMHVIFGDEGDDCALWVEFEGVPGFDEDGDYCYHCLLKLIHRVYGIEE